MISFYNFTGMARAALVVGLIIVRGHINDGSWFYDQITTLEKSWVLLPLIDLNFARHINRSTPGAITKSPLDDLIDQNLLTIDLNHLRHGLAICL